MKTTNYMLYLVFFAIAACRSEEEKTNAMFDKVAEELSCQQYAYIGKKLDLVSSDITRGHEKSTVVAAYYPSPQYLDNPLIPARFLVVGYYEYLINSDSVVIDVRLKGADPHLPRRNEDPMLDYLMRWHGEDHEPDHPSE